MFDNLFKQLTSDGRESEEDDKHHTMLKESRRLIHGSSSDDASEGSASTITADSISSSSSTEGDEATSELDDDSEHMESPEEKRLAYGEKQWDHQNYLGIVPSRVYRDERRCMVDCYQVMRREFSRQTPHYLLPLDSINLMEGRFRCHAIYIQGGDYKRGQRVTHDTFLVSRVHHYLYSYLVDFALRRHGESDEVRKARRHHLRKKMHTMHFCHQHQNQHMVKRCPKEFVLYTKKSSEFFRLCQGRMDSNPYMDYTEGYIPMEMLSYHLVNFMCGPFEVIAEQRFDTLNTVDRFEVESERAMDWVTVPLFFLDLWNASRPHQTNTNY